MQDVLAPLIVNFVFYERETFNNSFYVKNIHTISRFRWLSFFHEKRIALERKLSAPMRLKRALDIDFKLSKKKPFSFLTVTFRRRSHFMKRSLKQWLRSSSEIFFHLLIIMLFIHATPTKSQWRGISTSTIKTASRSPTTFSNRLEISHKASVGCLFRVLAQLMFYYDLSTTELKLWARLRVCPSIRWASSVSTHFSRWIIAHHARDIITIIQDHATAIARMSWGKSRPFVSYSPVDNEN